MKTSVTVIALICFHICFAQQKKDLVLWYDQPAKDWNEALPIGNGRLGAMIFGRPGLELVQLNEQTLWTGGPANLNPNPGASKYLQPVRDALFKDSISQAVKLLKQMQGPDTEMYQPLGDLLIKQDLNGPVTKYYRALNISTATSVTKFTVDGIEYTREIFSSAPAQVIVIKLTASKAGTLNFVLDINHELKYEKSVAAAQELLLKGKVRITNDERSNPKPLIYDDSANCDGMRFQFRVKAILKGGRFTHSDTSLIISGATETVLIVSAATSFNGYDKCPVSEGEDESKIASDYLKSAIKKPYKQLLAEHINDYQKYFNRTELSLGKPATKNIPTDKRLADYKSGKADPSLEELYFQFGRYLLISSSRPGGQPANLQGIWNNLIRPPWRSNYTTNINLQMNYWMAQPANLDEMELPLVEHIKRLAKNGTATAKNYYNMQGWAVHHNSDIWAQTNPVGEGNGDPKWANWSLGSPWLSQHLYERYRFTSDKKYLKETAYPLMKSAAMFCLDWLVEKDGKLLTAPSTSPENVYLHPNGFKGTVTIASAMDMEIIWDLFTNLIEAGSILDTEKEFTAMLKLKREKLHPLRVGKKGNLVEWFGDWEDEDPQHRHVSHLFGLHPGREISPLLDSSLSNAARKTLDVRGDGGTGWSKAWKINFWARLLDGDHAYKMYQELLKTSTMNNLFDTHPPFQIDGNFGAAAGIVEMLVQSHLTEIQLLPALPVAWSEGHVKGLRARGNFNIEIVWKDGKMAKAFITSNAGNVCNLRTNEKIKIKQVTSQTRDTQFSKQRYITTFTTQKGKKYEIEIL